MSLLSTAPQQISTHSRTQNQKNQYDTNPKLSDQFSLVHTTLNQSINQNREKEITENPKTEKNRSSSTTPICLLEVVIFSSLS